MKRPYTFCDMRALLIRSFLCLIEFMVLICIDHSFVGVIIATIFPCILFYILQTDYESTVGRPQ